MTFEEINFLMGFANALILQNIYVLHGASFEFLLVITKSQLLLSLYEKEKWRNVNSPNSWDSHNFFSLLPLSS